MVMFQACTTSPRLGLPSPQQYGFLPLETLDSTTIQGCCKPFFRRESGNPRLATFWLNVFCASDCFGWQMGAGLVACNRLFYGCRGRFGCCLDVFGAHPAFSLVLVCGGFDGRFPIQNDRRTLNGHLPSLCYISTATSSLSLPRQLSTSREVGRNDHPGL